MRIQGKLKRCSHNVLSFEIPYNISLELGKDYALEIKPYKSSRSLKQNALLWGLIQQMSDETGNDPMDIYVSALESANAKFEYIAALPQTEDSLRKVFRAVKPISTFMSNKGVEMVTYKCWIGSSRFDKDEMTKLIDYVLQKASEMGIYLYSL